MPTKTWLPLKARSELVAPSEIARGGRGGAPGAGGGASGVGAGGAFSCGVVPTAKPGGLGRLTMSFMPKAASAASR